MWLLINLSKKYTTTLTYSVEFLELPQDKILQETPVQKINVEVMGSGFYLFAANFSRKKLPLDLSKLKKKSKTDFYLLTAHQKAKIQEKISSLEIVNIVEDSIYFKLGTLATKKVQVIPKLNLAYKLGYGTEKVTIEPDSISISGPELQLKKIKSITTKSLNLEDVSENITTKLAIEMSEEVSNVRVSHESVEVSVLIDEFTEGNFDIPIRIINIPKEIGLNTFPKKVKVTYKVGLKNYQKITEDLFHVVCDYNKTKENELTYLIPELKKEPELTSSVRISPQKIDFLIQK